jgi:hypothetical protein
VYGALGELEALALAHDAVLTPHVCAPLEDDGRVPSALDINRTGQFNLGFAAFRAGPQTDRALRWWENRCRTACVADAENGIFVDQGWANLFASFLDVKVLRSEAFNMAYWNVHQRTLRRDEDGRWVTADGPLVFFHFSGLEAARVEEVSKYQNRVRAEPGTPLRAILDDYVRTIAESPWAAWRSRPYSLAPQGATRGAGPLYAKLNGALKRAFPGLHYAAKSALNQRTRKRIKRLFA